MGLLGHTHARCCLRQAPNNADGTPGAGKEHTLLVKFKIDTILGGLHFVLPNEDFHSDVRCRIGLCGGVVACTRQLKAVVHANVRQRFAARCLCSDPALRGWPCLFAARTAFSWLTNFVPHGAPCSPRRLTGLQRPRHMFTSAQIGEARYVHVAGILLHGLGHARQRDCPSLALGFC